MPELGEPLSQRELEVLHCVRDGASNKQIAHILSISQNTVKVHLRNIFSKLGVSSRTEAMTAALQQGLVTLPGDESQAEEAPENQREPADAPQADPSTSALAEADLANQAAAPIPVPRLSRLSRSMLAGLLLVSVIIAVLLGLPYLRGELEPTPEPFTELPQGDTGWFESRQMAEGRAAMAVASVGLDVYQIGGETEAGVDNAVRYYDTIDYSWHDAAAKPTAVADASAAVLFGEIYVAGGRLADGKPTAVVEAYSPANDAWRPVTALPQPVAGGLAVADGSFLYIFGGWNGDRYLDTAYVYDVGADSWRPLPSMKGSRAFAAGGAISGHLYVVGGFDGESELSDCHYFDSTGSQWIDCPDMLIPRGGAGAAVVLNQLFVIGGGLQDDSTIAYSEVFDPNSETWQVVNTPVMDATSRWAKLGVTNVEVRIYTLGGRRDGALFAGNFAYAPRVYKTFIPAAASGTDN